MSEVGAGMLLVAGPGLLDPHFADTVVLLLDADAEGAVGVVLNRPTPVSVEQVLEGWDRLVVEPDVLFQGGPVSADGAIALALLGPGEPPAGFRPVVDRLGLVDLGTPVEQVADALLGVRVFAGYAGWGAGQLEGEIAGGDWLVVPGTADDVFRDDVTDLRRDVVRRQPGELAWHATRPADPELN
ncbi:MULTISPECIES: YqgE/AlgH family protein [unclassified Nocardioides]|uniref:YqgE/AlgH family protein n=1 Tax=unclassified Nocardioides TaxID=2615069 RepID=UPI000702CAF1|nr:MULTISPECIES: YqgE/AlgH family protein [unclassified Nocardioides]KQQ43127.1 hypothetical protein ASF50_03805 [Nocardioides sp. Leaf307]